MHLVFHVLATYTVPKHPNQALRHDALDAGAAVCLLGFVTAAAAVVGRARHGLSTSAVWQRLLAAGVGALGIGAASMMMGYAFGGKL